MAMRPLPSVMSHDFSMVPKAEIPRSSFDRSNGHKTSFNAGYLIPVLCEEVLPGDTFNVKMTAFARLATPIFPVMDKYVHELVLFLRAQSAALVELEEVHGRAGKSGR